MLEENGMARRSPLSDLHHRFIGSWFTGPWKDGADPDHGDPALPGCFWRRCERPQPWASRSTLSVRKFTALQCHRLAPLRPGTPVLAISAPASGPIGPVAAAYGRAQRWKRCWRGRRRRPFWSWSLQHSRRSHRPAPQQRSHL